MHGEEIVTGVGYLQRNCADPDRVQLVRLIDHERAVVVIQHAGGAFVTTGGLFCHLAVQKPRAGRIGRPFA